jgi:hypothetical protein
MEIVNHKISNFIFMQGRGVHFAIPAKPLLQASARVASKENSKTSSLIRSAPTCGYPERIPFSIGRVAPERGALGREGRKTVNRQHYGIEGHKHRNI